MNNAVVRPGKAVDDMRAVAPQAHANLYQGSEVIPALEERRDHHALQHSTRSSVSRHHPIACVDLAAPREANGTLGVRVGATIMDALRLVAHSRTRGNDLPVEAAAHTGTQASPFRGRPLGFSLQPFRQVVVSGGMGCLAPGNNAHGVKTPCGSADNVLGCVIRSKFSSSSGSPRKNPRFAPHSTARKFTQEEVVECLTPTRC